MNSSHLLLLGSLVGATAALVAWKEFKSDAPEDFSSSSASITSTERGASPVFQSESQADGKRPRQSPFNVNEMLSLDENASIQSEENLSRLKAQSERRLKQLEQSLFLSPGQSQQIYSLIARSSPLFTPEIAINGTQAPALSPSVVTGEVHDVLDPDQQGDYVDDLLAEKEWWDELVVELEAEIDADLTPNSPASVQVPEKKTEEDQTPFNLFKTLSD